LKLEQILQILDSISPFELQEPWDNSGLQVGDMDARIEQIYLSLDLDSELIDSLPPRSLVITHHPSIFGKLSRIQYDRYPDRLIVQMIKKDIAHVAMHTNFDKTHLNRYVAERVLGVECESEGFVCYFERAMAFEEALAWVQEAFGLRCPRYVRAKERIERIALTTGSGGGLIGEIRADLFLTGDLKYHDAMKARELGLSVIDIGHYESERFFVQALDEQLKKERIKAIIATVKNPLKVSDETVH